MVLVDQGFFTDIEEARRWVMAGKVLVNDRPLDKPGMSVPTDAHLRIRGRKHYASRGGYKLEAVLAHFAVAVTGQVALDCGASSGGFTDCLLQHGAAKVYAIDVGKGSLHWKLRSDPRVVVMEATNARYVESLPETVQVVTIDASFISLKILLPVVKKWLARKDKRHREGWHAFLPCCAHEKVDRENPKERDCHRPRLAGGHCRWRF